MAWQHPEPPSFKSRLYALRCSRKSAKFWTRAGRTQNECAAHRFINAPLASRIAFTCAPRHQPYGMLFFSALARNRGIRAAHSSESGATKDGLEIAEDDQ